MKLGTKLLLVFVVMYNLLYNAFLPLHPDEAYYWVWSRNLQLSYYDHPPMVAYFIFIVTLFGESEFIIRLAAAGAMTAAALLVYRLGSRLFSPQIGETALWIYLLIPMTHLGFLVITPDPVLSFFWALSLFWLYKGTFEQNRFCLVLAGGSIGCMLLAKYTGVLLPASFILFLVFTPRFRGLFGKKELYFAVASALLVFLPVIIWNAHYDWASFRYQFNHGVATEKVVNPLLFGEFFAGQAAVSNPVFFFCLLFFLLKLPLRHLREPRLAFLAWPFAFTLLFLGYHGLYKKSELNWAMPAMISGSVLLAYWLERYQLRRLIAWAGVFIILAIWFFKGPELIPWLPGEYVMKSQFAGYDELFHGVPRQEREFVLSDTYQNASELAYYLPGRPAVYILEDEPVSQYTFWRDRLNRLAGQDALWIGQGEPSPVVTAAFERVERAETLTYQDRFVKKEYQVFRCYQFKR